MRILSLVFLISLLNPPIELQAADKEGGTFRVQQLKGKILRHYTDLEEEIRAGDLLPDGTNLRVAWRSNAQLRHLACESTIRIAPRARVLLGDEEGGRMLYAERGRLRAEVHANADDDRLPWIETPQARVTARDSEFGLAVGRKGGTLLVVFSGSVEVQVGPSETEPFRVEAGTFVSIRHGEVDHVPEPHELTPRGWDQGESPWPWDLGDDA